MNIDKYALLTIAGDLCKAIDDTVYWFVESRRQGDLDKRHIFNAIWETKERQYRKILDDAYAKLR